MQRSPSDHSTAWFTLGVVASARVLVIVSPCQGWTP